MINRFTEYYFGSCTFAVSKSARLPSKDSYGYLVQSRPALLNTSNAPESKILMRITD